MILEARIADGKPKQELYGQLASRRQVGKTIVVLVGLVTIFGLLGTAVVKL